MESLKDLELLVRSRYPIIGLETYEEARAVEALRRVAVGLKLPFFVWTLTEGIKRLGLENAVYETQPVQKALSHVEAIQTPGLYLFKDLHRYLQEAEVIRKVQDLANPFSQTHSTLVILAPHLSLPPELEKLAARFKLELPTDRELKILARGVIQDLSRQHPIEVKLSSPEFERLVNSLKGLTLFQAERAISRAVLDDMALDHSDLDHMIQIKREFLEKEGVLEYLPPDDDSSSFGGMGNLRAWLEKRQQAFTPEARRFGIQPPKGIILLGVQGCGKSLAAKAVARDWQLPLLRMEAGRLYDKYVGESDKNLEKALRMSESMAPCVLMIDEIEKGFAEAGGTDADGGLSRRIFGRLLSWLQDRKETVFVVATCNDISRLPPELMRKGRFDEIFFVDLPSFEERIEIFKLHLRRRKRNPVRFELEALSVASAGFSGAEIEQAIVSSLYTAFSDGSDLSTQHLIEEIKITKPLSVTREEEVKSLRQWAQGRTVMAS